MNGASAERTRSLQQRTVPVMASRGSWLESCRCGACGSSAPCAPYTSVVRRDQPPGARARARAASLSASAVAPAAAVPLEVDQFSPTVRVGALHAPGHAGASVQPPMARPRPSRPVPREGPDAPWRAQERRRGGAPRRVARSLAACARLEFCCVCRTPSGPSAAEAPPGRGTPHVARQLGGHLLGAERAEGTGPVVLMAFHAQSTG